MKSHMAIMSKKDECAKKIQNAWRKRRIRNIERAKQQ
jgi:hypothetical protein